MRNSFGRTDCLRAVLCLVMMSWSSATSAEIIAMIGTGEVGSALGPEFAAQGHDIVYGSRNPDRDSVRELVRRTGGSASATGQADAVAQATGRLISESRFDAAITDLRHDMESGLAKQAAALESGLAKQAAALESGLVRQAAAMESSLAKQAAALTELRREMEVGFDQQAAAFAEAKAEIYRYLWVLGGSLVVVLSSLYMLAETWSRGLI